MGDVLLRRIAVFSLDGQFLRSINYPQVSSESTPPYSTYFVYPINDDQTLVAQQRITSPSNSNMMWTSIRYGLCNSDGELLFDISTILRTMPFPYEGSEIVRYQHGQGILWTDGNRPLMRWYNLDGSVRITIRVEITPEPVTIADRRRVREQQQQLINEAEVGELRDVMVQSLEEMEFPDFKGFTHDARPDEYGFIWAPEPLDILNDPPWLFRHRLFSPEGEYLGETIFPDIVGSNLRYYISRGYLIYSFQEQDSGIPSVVLYRIIPNEGITEFPF